MAKVTDINAWRKANSNVSDIVRGKGPKLTDALKTHNEYVDNERDVILTETFIPAMSKFYEGFEKSLGKKKLNPADKTEGSTEKVREALTDALLEYFGVAESYVAKKAKGMMKKGVKTERVFEFLANQYDLQTGAQFNKDHISIKELYNNSKKKGMTVAKLKGLYKKMEGDHADWAMQTIDQQKFHTNFSHLHEKDWHDYLGPKMASAGLEIDEEDKYLQLRPQQLFGLSRALDKGQWGDAGYKGFHLKEKPKKKAA